MTASSKSVRKGNQIVSFGILLFMGLNFFSNVINILPVGLYYRFLLVIEIVLILMSLSNRFVMYKREAFNVVFIVIVQIVAYIATITMEDYFCFDIHRLLMMVLMIIALFYNAKNMCITNKSFEQIMSWMLMASIVAILYNFYMNSSYILPFNLSRMMYYTDRMKGFFLTRSNYCYVLCIGVAICIYRFKRNKGFYGILFIVLLGNIVLTNARTSLIAVSVMLVYEIWHSRYNRKLKHILIIIFLIMTLVLIPWERVLDSLGYLGKNYELLFTRNNGGISSGRFDVWKLAIDDTNIVSFFIGHGIGSKDAYLNFLHVGIGSFHSLYVDLFYEGGILLLILFGYYYTIMIFQIKKSGLDFKTKKLFYEIHLMTLFAGIGDAIASPFMLDTGSVLSTLLLFTLPIALINGTSKI